MRLAKSLSPVPLPTQFPQPRPRQRGVLSISSAPPIWPSGMETAILISSNTDWPYKDTSSCSRGRVKSYVSLPRLPGEHHLTYFQRLAKWFTTLSPKDKAKIVKDVSQLVLARRTRMCNFLEYKGSSPPLACLYHTDEMAKTPRLCIVAMPPFSSSPE